MSYLFQQVAMTSWKPALNKAALEILFYFYNNCLENTVV